MPKARIAHANPSTEVFIDEGCHITEWWNVDEDTALSIARARVAPGVTTRWHRLHGIVERYVVSSGVGEVEVEGLERQRVGPGAVVYIPAGAAQRIANIGAEDLIFLALCTPRFRFDAYQDAESG